MNKFFIACVCLLSCLSSCTPHYSFHWSYVQCYFLDVFDFRLQANLGSTLPPSPSGAAFSIHGVRPIAKKELTWPARNSDTPKEDEAKFEALSLQNGDWSYNQEFESLSAGQWEQAYHIYLAVPIVRVNFTSSQAWDGEHPAGMSLNDVLMCYTATPDDYIRSGYRRDLAPLQEKMEEFTDPLARTFWQHVLKKTRGDQTPIVGRFSEIDFRKYRLIGRYGCPFFLSSLITPPKGADLKMEVEFEDGRTVESTFAWPEQ